MKKDSKRSLNICINWLVSQANVPSVGKDFCFFFKNISNIYVYEIIIIFFRFLELSIFFLSQTLTPSHSLYPFLSLSISWSWHPLLEGRAGRLLPNWCKWHSKDWPKGGSVVATSSSAPGVGECHFNNILESIVTSFLKQLGNVPEVAGAGLLPWGNLMLSLSPMIVIIQWNSIVI